ncbi:MAG: class I SAM-dependent methyltransferase [Vicinamibacteria bacterium]|jgi:SAM-dependent methyltransferase|nr:class I SAM-dependent methyltransferase [Vicinamibacteria bacterium]
MGSNPQTPVGAQRLEPVACNLCGGDEFRVLFESTPTAAAETDIADFVASTDRFDRYGRIVRCRACGLVYTNPRPTQEQLLRSYTRVVDHEYSEENASRSINAHMCLHTLRRFVRAGRLLDVGCATGFFLNAARMDFEVAGLEPSEWAADYARTQLRLDVHTGEIEQSDMAPGSFDVVTLIDVIEHFTDPMAVLQKIAGVLRRDGLLYLVTPNILSLSARLLRGKWWGLRPAHLYYFSPGTLCAMLQACGLRVVHRASYGRVFTYQYWLSRLRNYPRPIEAAAARLIRLFGVERKFLYLDTRDSMEICAIRE